jgi:acetyl-CoA carboxylase biotin carboxylase subunit
MKNALDEMVVEGIKTNQPLHRRLVRDGGFKQVDFTIHYLEKLIRD